jgi:hypothetical protein
LNPDLPAELERIINRALKKDRDLRYQHASDMRAELQRLKRDTDSSRSAPIVSASWGYFARQRRCRARDFFTSLFPYGWCAAGHLEIYSAPLHCGVRTCNHDRSVTKEMHGAG